MTLSSDKMKTKNWLIINIYSSKWQHKSNLFVSVNENMLNSFAWMESDCVFRHAWFNLLNPYQEATSGRPRYSPRKLPCRKTNRLYDKGWWVAQKTPMYNILWTCLRLHSTGNAGFVLLRDFVRYSTIIIVCLFEQMFKEIGQ